MKKENRKKKKTSLRLIYSFACIGINQTVAIRVNYQKDQQQQVVKTASYFVDSILILLRLKSNGY